MKKVDLNDEQIKKIADDLDSGMVVYVHKRTKEIKTIIDFNRHIFAEEEMWEDEINEIEKNFDLYLQFESMESREEFRLMDEFVQTVDDKEVKSKLELGLSLSKPFRNFKDILDDYSEYRNEWFLFKEKKYIEFVKDQLNRYNNQY